MTWEWRALSTQTNALPTGEPASYFAKRTRGDCRARLVTETYHFVPCPDSGIITLWKTLQAIARASQLGEGAAPFGREFGAMESASEAFAELLGVLALGEAEDGCRCRVSGCPTVSQCARAPRVEQSRIGT
jgi:hypothetical protein